jgi:hypothetical protein
LIGSLSIRIAAQCQDSSDAWQGGKLHLDPRVWRRTHDAIEFTVVGRRTYRPRLHRGPAAIWAWVREGDVLDSRFLMAGLSSTIPRHAREKLVRRFISRGVVLGVFADAEEVRVPHAVFAPSAPFMKLHECPAVLSRATTLSHNALAIESALRLGVHRAGQVRVLSIEDECLLQQKLRHKRGVTRRGMALGATADAKIELPNHAPIAVELLSKSYRSEALAEKFESLPYHVDFVTTSPAIARRFVRVNPSATCYYF